MKTSNKKRNRKVWVGEHDIQISSPVVIDGIKGDGVFSVLCLGVAVVNGALIFMTFGRTKLCKRIFPVGENFEAKNEKYKNLCFSERSVDCKYPLTVIKLRIFLDEMMMAH